MLRLPRLPQNVGLVDKLGAATLKFQRWWQSVVERIEDAINRADFAQTSADTASLQALDAAERAAEALERIATQPNGLEGLERLTAALDALASAPAAVAAVATQIVPEMSLQMPLALELNGLADLTVKAATDRQTLIYDGTTAFKWINGSLNLGDLGDVVLTAPAAGNILIWNATSSEFVNAQITAGANITITPADGSITIAAAGVSGASGSFTTVDGKTVTVSGGLVSSIV